MNTLDFIMEVESDGFDPDSSEHVKALQGMIDSGLAWKLQGFWGRLASAAIKEGICHG